MLDASEQLYYLILRNLVPNIIVSELTGCYFVSNRANPKFYQYININKKRISAHVLSARLFLDYKPKKGLVTCHKCDTPGCFNPNHLFIGTTQENVEDYWLKKNNNAIGEINFKIDEFELPNDFDDLKD